MTIIQTYTGRMLDINNPDPAMIDLIDIAHGLSFVSRFGGQTVGSLGYSVAQHSMLVAELLRDPRNIVAALLHDASEAYTGDVPSPIKKALPDFQRLENRLMFAIAKKFRFDYPVNKDVRDADFAALQIERQCFMIHHVPWPGDTDDEVTQVNFRIITIEPAIRMYDRFLRKLGEVGFDVGLQELG